MLCKVYVAGASSEIDRVESVIAALEAGGVTITSTWTQQVRKHGAGNPNNLTEEDLVTLVSRDIEEVRASDFLLLLLPIAPTVGAWIELGLAQGINLGRQPDDRIMIHTAGIHRPIFTPVLSQCHFDSDGLAVADIVNTLRVAERENFKLWKAARR